MKDALYKSKRKVRVQMINLCIVILHYVFMQTSIFPFN